MTNAQGRVPTRTWTLSFTTIFAAMGAFLFEPLAGCRAEDFSAHAPAGPTWAHNLPIYETWLDLSTPTDKFSEFEQRLDALQDMGVGIIWFVPIFTTDVKSSDKPNHPYTVSDFYNVSPRHGTKEDFKHLVDAIHAHGMYVMMDFVPHHTAWDNTLMKSHPDFYKRDKTGQIESASSTWKGAAKLDYSNHALWEYMYNCRRFWMTKYNVDAFREDQAGLIPQEYWDWLRPRLEAVKPVFMLAEAEKTKMYPAFDMTYDWTSQAYFYMIARGEWPANKLDAMLDEEHRTFPAGALRMRHLTNHDMERNQYGYENRSHLDKSEYDWLKQTPLQEKYNGGENAFFILCATLPNSKPMVWNGQEQGILGNTPRLQWNDSTPYFEFYRKMLHCYRDNRALYEGDFRKLVTSAPEAVYAFERRAEGNQVIVIVNLSTKPQRVRLESAGIAGAYKDVFSGEKQDLPANLQLDLGAWGYRIYVK